MGDKPLLLDRHKSAVRAIEACVETLSQHNIPLLLLEVELRKDHSAPQQLSFWEMPEEQELKLEEALLNAALPLWLHGANARRRNG